MDKKRYDVVVVGGGLSGVAASIAVAREGASVLLIESAGCLGGAACNNLVNPFMAYWRTVDGKRDVLNQGIFKTIVEELKKIGGMAGDSMFFHEEYLKLVLDRLVKKHGVDVLLHTSLSGVDYQKGKLERVTVLNKSGVYEIEADYFIDATGDADLIAFAGLPFEIGDENGQCQPMTLCFNIGNVHYGDMSYFEVRKAVNGLYKEWQDQGKIKNPRENVLIFRSVLPGVLHFNSTRIVNKNPVDGEDLTKAEMEAREQMFELFAFLKENFKIFKNSYIINSAPYIGVRESRRVVGEYCLTAADVLDARKFPNSIARGNYSIDIHNPAGSGTVLRKVKQGDYYTIPVECLIPKGAKNVLVTGRCISASHEAQASLRIMPITCCIGEGAGCVAAVASKNGVAVKEVDMDTVQKRLVSNGALL